MRGGSLRDWRPVARAIEQQEKKRAAAWLAGRLALLPVRWSALVGRDHKRRGGLAVAAANAWLLNTTEAGRGRLSLAASDDDLRKAARGAAREGVDIAAVGAARGGARLRCLLEYHCERWGIAGPGAAELRAAVESTEWELSQRERGIIERLNAKQALASESVAQAGLFSEVAAHV